MLLPHAVSGPRAAEKSLADAADSPNYGLMVLRLVAEHTVDDQIRHAAAVNFKIHLRYRWAPSSDSNSGTTLAPILDPEKEQIKALIVTRMLSSSTPRIQSQLSEALAVIGKRFPKIVAHSTARTRFNLRIASQSNDYASINGILGTTNSIFKKFCYQCKTNDLLLDLKIVSIIFALIDSTLSSGGSAVTLQRLFESQRLYCRIFYSLNFQDLPEFFEDHMKEWMGEFKKYLTTIYPALESSSDGLGVVDELKAAVCENISLYMEVNEEFQGYLNDFALSV